MTSISTSQPETLQVGDDSAVIRVSSAMSDGAVVALEVLIPAGGGPPMLHRHAADELYRVETGTLTFYMANDEGEIVITQNEAGDVVYIPGGAEHTIRNETSRPSKAFVVFSGDAAPMENFLRASAEMARDGSLDPKAVTNAATRHGIEMTRPL